MRPVKQRGRQLGGRRDQDEGRKGRSRSGRGLEPVTNISLGYRKD